MSIGSISAAFKEKWTTVQVSAFAPLLSDEEILAVCEALGHRWRKSPFPPPAVVRSMVYRSLHPDKSIQNVTTDLAADWALDGGQGITPSAWCQGRSRLPAGLLPDLVRRSASRAVDHFGKPHRWLGREVYIVDGTTVTMPDDPTLAEAFGYTNSKHGRSRFPVARVVALLHAGVHVIPHYRVAPNRTSETELFRDLLPCVSQGAVWVGDRYYSSYVNFALSMRLGIDWVSRLHQRRNGRKLAKDGQRLGPDDWLVTLKLSDPVRREHPQLDLPAEIAVRLLRLRYRYDKQHKSLWIVTSLLDPASFPREAVVALYRRRWGIETHYSYLKTTLDMAVLRSCRPKHIRSEIAATILAHNLTWTLIHEATDGKDIPPERISFAGAVKTVLAFSPRLCAAPKRKRIGLYRLMLDHIALHRNRHRPGRREPRMIKRHRKRYPMLKTTRQEARNAA